MMIDFFDGTPDISCRQESTQRSTWSLILSCEPLYDASPWTSQLFAQMTTSILDHDTDRIVVFVHMTALTHHRQSLMLAQQQLEDLFSTHLLDRSTAWRPAIRRHQLQRQPALSDEETLHSCSLLSKLNPQQPSTHRTSSYYYLRVARSCYKYDQ